MKVNGLKALRLGKVLESLRGQMAQFMRGGGPMTRLTVRADLFISMDPCTQEIG